MAINSVSPGSYNSPSVQPQAQVARVTEKTNESVSREEKTKAQSAPERTAPTPTVNTSGQTVGTLVNVKA
ncbi:MAG: hypothetical protein WC742_08630 [Gallionellaceae bacterium]|jgi:hypothetical protein